MDKRRFVSKLYFVLLTCLLILPCSKDVSGAVWRQYFKGEGLLFFYYAGSIKFLPNNIIQVWIKIIPESEEDRARAIQNMRNINSNVPDNWGLSTLLFEINCKNKTYRCLSESNYNIKDELIKSDNVENPPYKHITPETMMEALSKIVCVKKDLKKKGR